MNWVLTPGSVALFVAGLFVFVALAQVWPRRRAVGGGPLTGLLISMLVWTVLTGLEQAAVALHVKVTLSAFSYLGSVAVPVFFFLFCVEYSQSDSWLPRPRWIVWVVPAASVLAAFTNSWHHDLWTGFVREPDNAVLYEHGPVFWLMIAYSYVLVLAGVIVIIINMGRHDRGFQGQFTAVLLFSLFPIVGSVMYTLGLSPIPGMDPTPILFSITAVGLTWSLLRQGLLVVIPIAQATVLRDLQEAVVVLDTAGRIAMVNTAFKRWFGLTAQSVVGQPCDEVLAAWPELLETSSGEGGHQFRITHPHARYVDATRRDVRDGRNRVRGQVIVLRDVTALRLSERNLREANIRLTTQLQTIQTLQQGLREQALRDQLTGLYNRRYLEETVPRELDRVERDGAPLSLLMVDLDHFKFVNDEFGHAAGDRVLRWFGDLIRTKVRPGDIACRYGGEEFVVIMPGASREVARERADEIREAFSRLVSIASDNEYGDVTLSIGVSVYPEDATRTSELRRMADAALYEAKRGGRNRVVLYSDVTIAS